MTTMPAVLAGQGSQPVKLTRAAVGHSSLALRRTVAASVRNAVRASDVADQQTRTTPLGQAAPVMYRFSLVSASVSADSTAQPATAPSANTMQAPPSTLRKPSCALDEWFVFM